MSSLRWVPASSDPTPQAKQRDDPLPLGQDKKSQAADNYPFDRFASRAVVSGQQITQQYVEKGDADDKISKIEIIRPMILLNHQIRNLIKSTVR